MTAQSARVDREFRRLNPTRDGQDIEKRARCQDDSHPVGAVHPSWYSHGAASFCHCGRIVYCGALPVDRWPRPEPKPKGKPVFG